MYRAVEELTLPEPVISGHESVMFNREATMKLTNTITIKTILTALILSSGALSSLTFAQQPEAADSKVGSTVTINGCLHAGKRAGQFALLGVTERTADGSAAAVPYAIYWLDSNRELKPLVGEVVDVTGAVTKRDSRDGVIKIEVRSGHERSDDVKLEYSNHTVTTKPFGGPADKDSVVELTRPVYKIHVDSVVAIENQDSASACR